MNKLDEEVIKVREMADRIVREQDEAIRRIMNSNWNEELQQSFDKCLSLGILPHPDDMAPELSIDYKKRCLLELLKNY